MLGLGWVGKAAGRTRSAPVDGAPLLGLSTRQG